MLPTKKQIKKLIDYDSRVLLMHSTEDTVVICIHGLPSAKAALDFAMDLMGDRGWPIASFIQYSNIASFTMSWTEDK
jgi:hypothetical protein